MTVDEVLEQVERQKPNAVEERLKRDWVLELDRRNWEEMLCEDGTPDKGFALVGERTSSEMSDACRVRRAEGYGACEDVLRIPPPYDQAYVLYVIAMIEFVTQEYAGYQNTMTLFNSVMDAYKAWYRRRHRPKRSRIAL